MFNHLLVPVDGTELSERAILSSLELARQLGSRVTGFVAEPMAPLPSMGTNVAMYQRQAEAHQVRTDAHAHRVLERFAELAAQQEVPFEGHYQRSDSIDEAIVKAAEVFGCDLIVMATHGRGIFGELLFGSHTKHVLANSKLPLLVLH